MEANLRSSSLKMVIEHGIKSPKKYRDSLIHDWHIPEEYKSHLLNHFIAKDLVVTLRNKIVDGELTVGNHIYEVIWVHRPESIYKSDDKYALLSFRYCKYLECGYVLIKRFNSIEANINNYNVQSQYTVPFVDYHRNKS